MKYEWSTRENSLLYVCSESGHDRRGNKVSTGQIRGRIVFEPDLTFTVRTGVHNVLKASLADLESARSYLSGLILQWDNEEPFYD